MKITPDFEGRNDEYDDDTVRYYEEVNDDGYFYELYVLIDGKKASISVTNSSITVYPTWAGEVPTNMVPSQMFPDLKKLEWKHLRAVLRLLEISSMSLEEQDVLYQEWKASKSKQANHPIPEDNHDEK